MAVFAALAYLAVVIGPDVVRDALSRSPAQFGSLLIQDGAPLTSRPPSLPRPPCCAAASRRRALAPGAKSRTADNGSAHPLRVGTCETMT
jgi:hypothetical protein